MLQVPTQDWAVNHINKHCKNPAGHDFSFKGYLSDTDCANKCDANPKCQLFSVYRSDCKNGQVLCQIYSIEDVNDCQWQQAFGASNYSKKSQQQRDNNNPNKLFGSSL